MAVHDFRLILELPPEIADDPSDEQLEDLSNRLYEAGCDDGSLGKTCGVWEIMLHRKADDLLQAVRVAVKQVEGTGCRVMHVEPLDQPIFDDINIRLSEGTLLTS